MQPAKKPYKPGTWIFLGTVLGTFVGILGDRMALGMIFGFFVGIAIDLSKRKGGPVSEEQSSDRQDGA